MVYLIFNIILICVFWSEIQKVNGAESQHLLKIYKMVSKDENRNAMTIKDHSRHGRTKSLNITTSDTLPYKEAVTPKSWQKKPAARMRDVQPMRDRKHHTRQGNTDDSKNPTRITKMYLGKQTNRHNDNVLKKHGRSDNLDDTLSPYSLVQQMQYIFSDFPGANVTKESIGRTLEYNDIVLFKISESKDSARHFRADDSKYTDEELEKKIVFIVHGLSVMGMKDLPTLSDMEQLKTLVSYYIEYLYVFDIFFIPMANPDGYGYLSNSLWNKNLSPQTACPGVALDRNFDVAWNISRSPISSCNQLYPGSFPFSEPETRAIREVFHRYSHRIVAYFHVHAGSYTADSFKGEAVLYPRGYTDVLTDEDKYIDLKGEIDEAMKNASFHLITVTVDTLNSWYGKISGSSVDYASTVYGINYAMEFVMQIYKSSDENYSYLSLAEIWDRIINITFNNIVNSLNSNEVNK